MRYTGFLLVSALMAVQPAPAEIYRWVDEKGTVHYSERRPADPGADTVKTHESSGIGSLQAGPELEELRETAGLVPNEDEADQTGEEPGADQEGQQAQSDELRRNNCGIAKKNVAALVGYRRVLMKDEQGKLVRLDDAQREARLEEAREQVEQNCR